MSSAKKGHAYIIAFNFKSLATIPITKVAEPGREFLPLKQLVVSWINGSYYHTLVVTFEIIGFEYLLAQRTGYCTY